MVFKLFLLVYDFLYVKPNNKFPCQAIDEIIEAVTWSCSEKFHAILRILINFPVHFLGRLLFHMQSGCK